MAVRQGILFRSSRNSLELWNFELSQCIRSWELEVGREITGLIPISDDRVVCADWDRAIILDTTSKVGVIATKRFSGELVAFNSKCQLITFDGGGLRSVHGAVWEKSLTSRYSQVHPLSLIGMFTPTEQFLVISVSIGFRRFTGEVHVLEALSGNRLHMLCKPKQVCDFKFVSDEACVTHTFNHANGFRLQMFNVKSGDLLSLLHLEKSVYALGSCLRKGLIAIGLEDSELKFKIIQVKLPGTTKG